MIAEYPIKQFVRLSDDQHAKLVKLATKLSITPSAVLRLALAEKLERMRAVRGSRRTTA